MLKYDNVGLMQRTFSMIADLNQSTVSRYLSSHGIGPIDPSTKKHRYSITNSRKVLKELYLKNRKVVRKVQCFYNFKGGTGKTSLCFQVATHLALCGFNVLVIDADPQAHLSTLIGFNSMDNFLTLYDAIAEDVPITDIIQPIFEGLDCIPSNLSLTKVLVPLDQMAKREEVLKSICKPIEANYDFIIFDTNPTISTLNRNIITYSSMINIACETQPLSLNGLKMLIEDLSKFIKVMGMPFPGVLIIPNKYEVKTTSSAECMSALRQFYPEFLKPDFAVRKAEDINTSAKLGLPVSFFARHNSSALEDVIELLKEVVRNSCKNNGSEEAING